MTNYEISLLKSFRGVYVLHKSDLRRVLVSVGNEDVGVQFLKQLCKKVAMDV